MPSNYPPGTSGAEPQITGDRAFESWLENLKPGDSVWAFNGDRATVIEVRDDDLVVRTDDGFDIWLMMECVPPEDTPFHKWAAAQEDEDIPAWWEVK